VVAVAQPVPNINAHPSIYSPTTAAAQSAYTNMPANNGYASNGYGAMPPRLPGIPNQSMTPNSILPRWAQDTKPVAGFQYKSSPFYEMKARIGDVRICEGQSNRLRESKTNYSQLTSQQPWRSIGKLSISMSGRRIILLCMHVSRIPR
jgi:hypothetical protein